MLRAREKCFVSFDSEGVLAVVQSKPFPGAVEVTEAEFQELKAAREAIINARLVAEG